MRRFPFTEDAWYEYKSPRRFELLTETYPGDIYNIAAVVVWEQDGNLLKPAEVDIEMSLHGVLVTSSYKFTGEVRVVF